MADYDDDNYRNSNDADTAALTNKNIAWMDSSFIVLYLVVLATIRLTLYLIPIIPQEYAWTAIHICFNGLTFYFFHYIKGTPFWDADSNAIQAYDNLTFWEQIDGGVLYTANRKFLTIIPVLVFLLACYDTKWEHRVLFLNFFILVLFVLYPKMTFQGKGHQN